MCDGVEQGSEHRSVLGSSRFLHGTITDKLRMRVMEGVLPAGAKLPALRERSDDIPELIRHFFGLAEAEGLPIKTLDGEAMAYLRGYGWPGNVRELENLIRRLAVLYSQELIDLEVVRNELGETQPAHSGEAPTSESLGSAVERHLRDYFAAHRDGLPASGLYDRVQRGRTAAHRALAERDQRQPGQGGETAWTQPQYLAQEDSGTGHSGSARP